MRGIFFVNAPQKEQARDRVPVLFGGATLSSSRALRARAQNPVRIRRSEIGKLACQAKSVRIFARSAKFREKWHISIAICHKSCYNEIRKAVEI